ncbi:MAG: tRNA (adenosine(37)-N6)-threonylcarbamoyltransferase complex transferase subunit TsaD [Candidatus Yanofskybacteria bacterium RIFCSPLOWO2_01_FULL_49_25]|uniref:tRNA N6-adenosine threonylcarbamoyltransferase n=1 Tax=Candidatus Yanofskybacteria bacterium RIFCSPLOWO2_01_FULL_49_25 TaxID=1802701 RepID=A0A1F8GSB2_9BACT|nr:MAG: tRNA (adenosine(37)-N6)-threonylcarbamoyltransferase complex transferase subunit TsaD [Candidatus Yanofskybacteria bacterium RIFCSPLOWO2_01_FULL_49_25]
MLILGIETSCDDTSVAVLKTEDERLEVLSNIVSSQIKQHAPYGGIVPLLAAREHEKNLPVVLDEALRATRYTIRDIDLIAVTSGPGLIMSLVRGVNFAKELAEKNNKPLIGINHMEGHIYSNWLPESSKALQLYSSIAFPALCLIVSGGHTELVLMHDHGKYALVGRTVDDASGEAFDKIARLIGLEYPGGPAISHEAEKFDATRYTLHVTLPRPMLHSKDFNFSFSGLKTSVLYLVRDLKVPLENVRTEIAHEAQKAIVDVLISKTMKAAKKFQPKSILLAGGVSANKRLRSRLAEEVSRLTPKTYYLEPALQYTTDNAAMIACAAYFKAKNSKLQDLSFESVEPDANWEIV